MSSINRGLVFVLSFVLFALLGCATTKQNMPVSGSSPSASKAQPAVEESIPVIDVHTHTGFDGRAQASSGIPVTREEFVRGLREANVVGAVSHTGQDEWDVEDLKSEGVIHCAGLSPKFNARTLENGLKSGKFGCIKIYLGYVHLYAYDKAYQPAYKLAEKYDVPVVFHTGDTYSTKAKLKYADPLTIDEVAVDHPKVRFVIAHCGNPWIQSAAEVAYKNPNVYLDASAFLIGDLSEKTPEQIEELLVQPVSYVFKYVEDPSKLMFGSDWPLVSIKSYLGAFKRAIPREHWRAVLHDNAARVFKIKR